MTVANLQLWNNFMVGLSLQPEDILKGCSFRKAENLNSAEESCLKK